MNRKFLGLKSFATFLGERAEIMVPTGQLALVSIATALKSSTRSSYGDQSLPDLSEATQADRVAKGYSPNQPLYRDGALLRDSVEEMVGPGFAAVGSSQPVAVYQEFGFVNARTGKAVPPRPAFRLGFEKAAARIMAIAEDLIGVALGFRASLSSDIETHTTTYGGNIGIEET